ncbi:MULTISPECIES: hypothetical protein [Saccharothrix]|uniref:hypothetical protein n=1 Tax=Saccharothrix TaxID=2071 RepID=UPI0011612752|nr:hypothetical protein [Saccharothrix sp. CB00851]
MGHVLDSPAPLSARAQAFLAEHADRVAVDTGPDDDRCRAEMRAVLGYCDEQALSALRWVQQRYSGLTYRSPLRGKIVFEPVLEVDTGTGRIEFWYAIMDERPDGVSSGSLLPDGTLLFGLFDVDLPAFPSLDHFIECDALLNFANRQELLSTERPERVTSHMAELRRRHPSLRRLERESGSLVEWWSDGELLVFQSSLDAELTARVPDMNRARAVVQTWHLVSPLACATTASTAPPTAQA